MIELEVQVLAHTREGLLMDMGRLASANGFTLQRQRLVMGSHGALLTLVVAGAPRRQRALEDALQQHERVISHEVAPAEAGQMRPHFAAVRAIDTSGYVPSAPPIAPEAAPPIPAGPGKMAPGVPRATQSTGYDSAPPPAAPPPAAPTVELAAEPLVATRSATVERIEIPDEFLLPTPPPPPAPAPPPADPFVEIAALPPDEAAIARLLDGATVSAALVEQLRALEDAVAPGAREPTLHAAGLRLGRAMAPADAAAAPLTVADAVAKVGLPALRGMVDVVLQGEQLHIRHSPLCDRPGHSGCAFFGGLLQGALVPRVAAHEISVFNVCCRAWGADECVLAIAD